MALRKIHVRDNLADMAHHEFAYDEETGMEYYLYELEDGKYILGKCHDGVGLMTYYVSETKQEIIDTVPTKSWFETEEPVEPIRLDYY